MAYERLSHTGTTGIPDRASLLAARGATDLVILASWWGEDQEVADVLREQSPKPHLVRVAALTTALTHAGTVPETRFLLLSAVHDECPAVRRLALEGLARLDDPAWTAAATTDPDPYLRYVMCCFRSITDQSPAFSAELLDTLRTEADDRFSQWLFDVAAIRATTGLLQPAALAEATRTASYVGPAVREWLERLVRVTTEAAS